MRGRAVRRSPEHACSSSPRSATPPATAATAPTRGATSTPRRCPRRRARSPSLRAARPEPAAGTPSNVNVTGTSSTPGVTITVSVDGGHLRADSEHRDHAHRRRCPHTQRAGLGRVEGDGRRPDRQDTAHGRLRAEHRGLRRTRPRVHVPRQRVGRRDVHRHAARHAGQRRRPTRHVERRNRSPRRDRYRRRRQSGHALSRTCRSSRRRRPSPGRRRRRSATARS